MRGFVLPIATGVALFLGCLAPLDAFVEHHKSIVTAATEIGLALTGIGLAAGGIALLANPVSLITIGLGAMAIGVKAAYDNFKPFHDTVNSVASEALPLLKKGVEDAQKAFENIKGHLSEFASGFEKATNWAKQFSELGSSLKGALSQIGGGLGEISTALGMSSQKTGQATKDWQNFGQIVGAVFRAQPAG